MLKILVSCMAYDKGQSGISDYMKHVVEELVKENEVTALLLDSDRKIFPVTHRNLKVVTIPDWLGFPTLNMLWHLLILPHTLKKLAVDCIFLPAANRRLLSFYPHYTLAMFHDLSQFHIPGKYDPWRMFYIKSIVPYFLKKADSIMAISNNTKQDLQQYYGIAEADITVIYLGFDSSFFTPGKRDAEKTLLKKDYFLYLSRIEHPGKNHLTLIKAYEKLPREVKDRYDLLLPGKIWWMGGNIVADYVKNSPDADKIHLPGFVDRQQLPQMYRQAALYIFPSLYEGFGIPLLEAMASGAPVICSKTSSLPEIGGDAVVTFDPNDVDSIKAAILQVINNPALQETMRQKGLQRVQLFSWAEHARKIQADFASNLCH